MTTESAQRVLRSIMSSFSTFASTAAAIVDLWGNVIVSDGWIGIHQKLTQRFLISESKWLWARWVKVDSWNFMGNAPGHNRWWAPAGVPEAPLLLLWVFLLASSGIFQYGSPLEIYGESESDQRHFNSRVYSFRGFHPTGGPCLGVIPFELAYLQIWCVMLSAKMLSPCCDITSLKSHAPLWGISFRQSMQ